jgi:hypothetical protein
VKYRVSRGLIDISKLFESNLDHSQTFFTYLLLNHQLPHNIALICPSAPETRVPMWLFNGLTNRFNRMQNFPGFSNDAPANLPLMCPKRQKSHGTRSGEYDEWGALFTPFPAMNSVTFFAVKRRALSARTCNLPSEPLTWLLRHSASGSRR